MELGFKSSEQDELGVPSVEQPASPKKTTAPLKKSEYQRRVPEPIKNAIGGIESAGRMLWNAPAGMVAGGLSGLYGLAKEGSMDKAEEYMHKGSEAVAIKPFTEQGAVGDEMLGKAYDYVKRDVVGENLVQLERIRKKITAREDLTPEEEAIARSLYEGGFDLAAFGGMVKGGVSHVRGKAQERARLEAEAKKQEELAQQQRKEQEVKDAYGQGRLNQQELGMPEGTAIPPQVRSPYNLKAEEAKRLSEEIMMEVTPRGASERQGQLFGDRRAYPPEELGNRPQWLGENLGPGARDRLVPEPTDRLQEQGQFTSREGYPYQPMEQLRDAPERPIPMSPEDPGLRNYEAYRADVRANAGRYPIEPEGLTPGYQARPRGPRSQQGVIDPDILTFGVNRLLRDHSFNDVMKKFEGTFTKEAIDGMVSRFRAGISDIVFMKPDEFLGLAYPRSSVAFKDVSPRKQESIRKGLSTKEGLYQIPELHIDKDGRVTEHNGRHRMDIFKEQGMDLIPVEIKGPGGRPKALLGEKGMLGGKDASQFEIPYPRSARDKVRQDKVFEKNDMFPYRGIHNTPVKGGLGTKQGGWIGSLHKDLERKGVVSTLTDFKKQFNVDRRLLEKGGITKVVTEEGITKDTLKDIASNDLGQQSRLEKLYNEGLSNFVIDKTMSILSAAKGPVGALVKAVVDARRAITRDKDIHTREREQAVLNPWLELQKQSPKELMEMKEIWVDNVGKQPLTRNSFTTERQWNTFKTIQDVLQQGWEQVNIARVERGLKPISRINNYFPAIREGNYWITIKDASGQLKFAAARNTTWEINKLHKQLKREFGSEFEVSKPYEKPKSPYDLHSLDAFEETIRALDKNDPVTQAIQKRYAELAGHRGFAKTGIHRKGIPGALGFEKGAEGIRNAEKVLEGYIKRQEAYLANLKVAKLREEFAKLPKELRDNIPLAEKWINEYLSQAIGADLDRLTIVKDITGAFTRVIGIGDRAPKSFMSELGSLASVWWLMTPRFLFSQIAQPTLTIAKLMEMRGYDSAVVNPLVSYFDGYRRWFGNTADSAAPVKWAADKGYLDSSIAALLDLKVTDLRGQRWGALGAALRWPLAKLERSVVRGPVFLMFDSALRDSIKNEKQRWETAAELMDYYMTHYDRESSPLMYNKMGLVGEAARPLKQYSHNNFGQFFEYMQKAKGGEGTIGLATFMGTQALVGGLKGVILVAEAAAIITAINYLFGTEIPTPEEALLKNGISDWLVYGSLSNLLGADISSSVAAPGMPQMFSVPGLEFGANAVISSMNYLMKMAKGTATDADEMRAMMALSPNAMHGFVEELYTRPGGPVPKPLSEMKGVYRRRDEVKPDAAWWDILTDKQKAMLSLKSIDEAKANAVVRILKEKFRTDAEKKLDILDAIASEVANKKSIDPALIQNYLERGGDPNTLLKSIEDRLLGRSLTWEEHTKFGMSRSPLLTPNQINKLGRMKEFLDSHEKPLKEYEKMQEKEESNFKKMGAGDIELSGRVVPKSPHQIVDDGKATSQQTAAARQKWISAQFKTTSGRQLIAEARRLYPNDEQQQYEFVLRAASNLAEQQAKAKYRYKKEPYRGMM